ncbi:MAG: hypothetical protein WA324_19135 [Bryobacteraceae bacterium]
MHQWPFRRSSIGLLLLRIAATAMLLLFGHGDVNQLPPLPFQIVGLVLIACLLAGFCTSIVALLLALIEANAVIHDGGSGQLHGASLIVLSIAAALLGAGEYSIDGFLFGRRRIVIPPED